MRDAFQEAPELFDARIETGKGLLVESDAEDLVRHVRTRTDDDRHPAGLDDPPDVLEGGEDVPPMLHDVQADQGPRFAVLEGQLGDVLDAVDSRTRADVAS